MTRKIFKCFDLNNDANIYKIETKLLLDAFYNEFANNSTLKNNLRDFFTFEKRIKLKEMIDLVAKCFNVEIPKDTCDNDNLPKKLL